MIVVDSLTLFTVAALIGRATVVLSLTWLGARLAMRRSASTRHAVWAAGFIAALALPLAANAVPGWSLPVLPATMAGSPQTLERAAVQSPHNVRPEPVDGKNGSQDRRADRRTASAGATRATHAPQMVEPVASIERVTSTSWTAQLTMTNWLLLVWSVIGLVLLLRYVISLAAVLWLAKRAELVTDSRWREALEVSTAALGLSREPRLVASDAVSVPFTCGLLHPTLVVPAAADRWTSDRIRVVLLHELAHVARRDCLVQAVVQAVCAVYWFHPLAWVGARHLRAERERACDDLVLAAGTRGAAYAEHLLDIARAATGTRRMAVAALAMARPSELEGRLLAILDRGRDRARAERALLWKVAVLATVVVLPLASVQLVARAVLPEQTGPATTTQAATAPVTQESTDVHTVMTTSDAPTRAISSGVSRGVIAGVDRGISSGVSGGVSGGVAGGVSHGVSSAVAAGIGGGITGGVRAGIFGIDGSGDAQASSATPQGRQANEPQGRQDKESAHPIPPAVLQGLTEALKDSDAEVRKQAMQALAKFHAPGMYDVMAQALKDADPEVREQAAFALSQMRDQRAVPALVAALKDTNEDVRQQAAFALSQLRSAEAVPALSAALKDTDDEVREQALFALSQIRDASAVPAIMGALTDKADNVREQAAFALSQLGDPKAVPGLVAALKDKESSVRQQAAFALSQIGDESALEGLTAALKDPDAEVRQQAVFALSQIAEGRRGNHYHLQAAPVVAPTPDK